MNSGFAGLTVMDAAFKKLFLLLYDVCRDRLLHLHTDFLYLISHRK